MLLGEILFCMVFFILPLVGMLGIALKNILRNAARAKRKHSDQLKRTSLRRGNKPLSEMACVNARGIEYQLARNKVHKPLHLTRFKEKTHQRAGP